MLNIMFGQSKYYVDSLSENTKRGLREKIRRGEYPGPAPIGYLNDYRTNPPNGWPPKSAPRLKKSISASNGCWTRFWTA